MSFPEWVFANEPGVRPAGWGCGSGSCLRESVEAIPPDENGGGRSDPFWVVDVGMLRAEATESGGRGRGPAFFFRDGLEIENFHWLTHHSDFPSEKLWLKIPCMSGVSFNLQLKQ